MAHYTSFDVRLTNKVAETREKVGISDKELADKIGIDTTSLRALEYSYIPHTIITCHRIAKALNCTIEDLFTLDDS